MNKIRNDYTKHSAQKLLTIGKIAIILSFFILPYFIYEDIYISKLPSYTVLFRLLPLFFSSLIIILYLTPIKNNLKILKFLYISFLISLMTMMCFFIAVTINSHLYNIFLIGTLVVIICIYAGSVGGIKLLAPVYGVPLAALAVYLIIRGDFPRERLIYISNPIVITLVIVIIAEIQERLRYKEFKSKGIIEYEKSELEKKNDIIKIKNEQFDSELNLAKSIQNNLIPQSMPGIKGIKLSSLYLPMIGIGGDFFDFIRFKEENLIGIFISDVSGHGVSAALISSMVKTLVNTAGEEKSSPGQLLKYINEKLISQVNGHFVTAFYGIYNTKNKIFNYARGGHNFPFLIRNNRITELRSEGKILGIFDGLKYQENEIQLQVNDKLLFYTDGLVEAKNSEGSEFEEIILSETHTDNIIFNNQDFVKGIHDRLIKFIGNESFDDDICVVGMEVGH